MKHSPAPFTAKIDGCGGYNIVDARGRTIGATSGAFSKDIPAKEEDANAKLFAAAPDLLAACERLLKGPFVGGTIGKSHYHITDEDREAARAAIAKAGGAGC